MRSESGVFGLSQAGAIFVPLRPMLTKDDLAYMVENMEPTVMFADQGALPPPRQM